MRENCLINHSRDEELQSITKGCTHLLQIVEEKLWRFSETTFPYHTDVVMLLRRIIVTSKPQWYQALRSKRNVMTRDLPAPTSEPQCRPTVSVYNCYRSSSRFVEHHSRYYDNIDRCYLTIDAEIACTECASENCKQTSWENLSFSFARRESIGKQLDHKMQHIITSSWIELLCLLK